MIMPGNQSAPAIGHLVENIIGGYIEADEPRYLMAAHQLVSRPSADVTTAITGMIAIFTSKLDTLKTAGGPGNDDREWIRRFSDQHPPGPGASESAQEEVLAMLEQLVACSRAGDTAAPAELIGRLHGEGDGGLLPAVIMRASVITAGVICAADGSSVN
jgi:hypothetical protein